jgi:hypothetical protein
LAVANAGAMDVDNVIINSVIQVITARRVSRKLLATVVEIDFSVRVTDAGAASTLVSSGVLSKDNLDGELVKEVRVRVFICVKIEYVRTYQVLDTQIRNIAWACICAYKHERNVTTTYVDHTGTQEYDVSVVIDSLQTPICIHTGSDFHLQGGIGSDYVSSDCTGPYFLTWS